MGVLRPEIERLWLSSLETRVEGASAEYALFPKDFNALMANGNVNSIDLELDDGFVMPPMVFVTSN